MIKTSTEAEVGEISWKFPDYRLVEIRSKSEAFERTKFLEKVHRIVEVKIQSEVDERGWERGREGGGGAGEVIQKGNMSS